MFLHCLLLVGFLLFILYVCFMLVPHGWFLFLVFWVIMNGIIWNIRGIGNQASVDKVRKLVKDHNISWLCVLEPLIDFSNLPVIARKLGFDDFFSMVKSGCYGDTSSFVLVLRIPSSSFMSQLSFLILALFIALLSMLNVAILIGVFFGLIWDSWLAILLVTGWWVVILMWF